MHPVLTTQTWIRSGLFIAFLLFAVLDSALATAAAVPTEEARPRILVTNDDGIASPGLQALVTALAALGEVVVSAPGSNQSGSSQAITFYRRSMIVTPRGLADATAAYAVRGTPADAVSFGVLELGKEQHFDLLVSGINDGTNVGTTAHVSGTVGAAMAGALLGLPSIAVSQDHGSTDWQRAARFATHIAKQFLARGVGAGTVFSINVPATHATEGPSAVARPMGGAVYGPGSYELTARQDGKLVYEFVAASGSPPPSGSDTEAYADGRITVTPLYVDWTNRRVLEELEAWDLKEP